MQETGDGGSLPGWEDTLGKEIATWEIAFLPGKSHGQRILVGYSPESHKESDMIEYTHIHLLVSIYYLSTYCLCF